MPHGPINGLRWVWRMMAFTDWKYMKVFSNRASKSSLISRINLKSFILSTNHYFPYVGYNHICENHHIIKNIFWMSKRTLDQNVVRSGQVFLKPALVSCPWLHQKLGSAPLQGGPAKFGQFHAALPKSPLNLQ